VTTNNGTPAAEEGDPTETAALLKEKINICYENNPECECIRHCVDLSNYAKQQKLF